MLYLLLAAMFCLHLLADPAHRVTAGNPGDHALISYLLQAQPTALLHGHNPLWLRTMNAPDGVNVMWNTGLLLPAMLLAPVTAIFGGTFSFNVLLVAGLAGSAWTAYAVARRYTARRVPAFLAGLLFGFSPAMTHQANGHLHLVVAALVPLLLSTYVDVLSQPFRAATAVKLGVLAAAQLLTGEELLACTVIAAALLTTVLLVSRPAAAVSRLPAALRGLSLAAFAFTVLSALPLAFQFLGTRHQYGSPFAFDVFKSDLTGFTTADQLSLFHGAATVKFPNGTHPERNAFLGWPLLVLLALVVGARWHDVRVRVAASTGAVLAVFSLGGTLVAGGTYTAVRLPWSSLQRLPLLDGLLPNRFGLLVAGLAGFVLAVGLDSALTSAVMSSHPGRRLTAGVLASAALIPLIPTPLRAAVRPATPRFIATEASHRYLPTGSTVLALPFPTPTDITAMDWQADDGLRWSMPGGFFLGPNCSGAHCAGRAYLGPNTRATAALLQRIGLGTLAPNAITAHDLTQAARDLRYWRISRVLVGPSDRQPQLVAAVTTLLGRSGTRVDDCWIWLVPGDPPTS
jgi:hypothetical protein